MFDKHCEKNIWVSERADFDGDGSFEKPFLKIQTALNCAVPGSVIVLFSGIYDEKVVVRDLCGTVDEPITITAFNENAEDVISHCEWYFYSAKDFVVKGIVFRKTINSAISMIGESKRNSIKDCVFDECGEISECAVFFGGSGGVSNVVENCGFCAPKRAKNHIAVMISQSIDESEEKTMANSKNSSVRFCRFNDCKTAVMEGSDENVSELFGGHEVCDCLFENCQTGVKIKISGTQICGNIFKNTQNAVVNALGFENEIFENRFENCENAVVINSDDATIGENCFINSKITFDGDFNGKDTLPILILDNTFASDKNDEIISSQNKTASFATKNIFYNCTVSSKNIGEKDNVFEKNDIFADSTNGDFSANINYGCKSGAEKMFEIVEIPQVDIVEMFEKQKRGHINERAYGKRKHLSKKMIEERDLFIKSMCFQDESEEDEEIEMEAAPVGHRDLRPVGVDGELEDN